MRQVSSLLPTATRHRAVPGGSARELRIAALVAAWILVALAIDRGAPIQTQLALGAITWVFLLLLLLRREP